MSSEVVPPSTISPCTVTVRSLVHCQSKGHRPDERLPDHGRIPFTRARSAPPGHSSLVVSKGNRPNDTPGSREIPGYSCRIGTFNPLSVTSTDRRSSYPRSSDGRLSRHRASPPGMRKRRAHYVIPTCDSARLCTATRFSAPEKECNKNKCYC
jgi:hypothetical protein